ncbi:glycosyltransferase family 2 protein [Paenirhodobacter sp.]|uniref:glycosyltransferase family 2 protein n=1 Tax=Paenirhodobacter sp. TaxID=1965326 RepID=UPI003B3EAE86
MITRLRLRRERRLQQLRGLIRSPQLRRISDRRAIAPGAILACVTLRNEAVRLPYFLDYYRRLGVDHFLMIDNESTDGSADLLRSEPDVTLWHARGSYRAAQFGIDWQNHVLRHNASGHWVLTVDPDEFLVYPFCDIRPLRALTDWLDNDGARTFPAMLLDMYPRGPIGAQPYRAGQDPFEIACWFDAGNYTISRNPWLKNLWIQGGPRARCFFADDPRAAPALNKIPLVRWDRGTVYRSSTHVLLPRHLNITYDGGEGAAGCLLHAKFLSPLAAKIGEELHRGEHYAQSREYRAYGDLAGEDLWTEFSTRYRDWRQLEELGLMSRGGWA